MLPHQLDQRSSVSCGVTLGRCGRKRALNSFLETVFREIPCLEMSGDPNKRPVGPVSKKHEIWEGGAEKLKQRGENLLNNGEGPEGIGGAVS